MLGLLGTKPGVPPVMEGKGKESAFRVVPIVLMPCDILRLKELISAQEGMLPPELDKATAGEHQQVLAG